MAEFRHNNQPSAMRLMGPPMQEMFAPLGPNPTGVAYKVNRSGLELLCSKRSIGEEGEDRWQHLQFLDDVCWTFKLNAFILDDMKLKFFLTLWLKMQRIG